MKPIHIMRWAPADYVNDPSVKLAIAQRDFVSSAFYPLFLFHAFIQGGELPAEPVALGAILGMRPADVRRALVYWTEQGKIKERDGRLYHERIQRDIESELAFRAEQTEKGRLGGRPRVAKAEPLPSRNPVVLERQSPPSPLPYPTGFPAPAPPASAVPPPDDPPVLPPADRAERAIRLSTDALRTKLYALIDAMTREDPDQADPTELMRMVTAYDKPDGSRVHGVVNAALLTHERLEKSIEDAEAQLAEWRDAAGKAPAVPAVTMDGAVTGDRSTTAPASPAEAFVRARGR